MKKECSPPEDLLDPNRVDPSRDERALRRELAAQLTDARLRALFGTGASCFGRGAAFHTTLLPVASAMRLRMRSAF
eukprot:2630721-Pleurochrysis_carterae.AAC.1